MVGDDNVIQCEGHIASSSKQVTVRCLAKFH